MAETSPAAAKSPAEMLKRKVGPLPLGVWVVLALGVFLYVRHQQSAGGSTQTDPAGNTGDINPNTGYVYGSPEDKAALAGSAGTTTDQTSGSGGSTTAGTYPDNNAWGRAAINFLVGIGIDPSVANQAIDNYLSSQQNTTALQADVNLAIQGIGVPPDLPGPVGTNPTPVTKPPAGGGSKPPAKTVYASNPPSGFHVTRRTSTTISLKWNKVAHASGYVVVHSKHRGGQEFRNTTGATETQITIGGLAKNTAYYFEVWASPTKSGGPHAGPILGHTTK